MDGVEDDQAVLHPVGRVFERLLASQEAELARVRQASMAVDSELQRLRPPPPERPFAGAIVAQREIIDQSQAAIRRTCDAIERSLKLISRADNAIAASAARQRSAVR